MYSEEEKKINNLFLERIYTNRETELKELIELHKNKIDINRKIGNKTPLYYAACVNNLQLLEIIINNFDNFNVDGIVDYDTNDTLLHIAVRNKNRRLWDFLIEHRANCNIPNKDGFTQLQLITHIEEVERLAKLKNSTKDIQNKQQNNECLII